MKVLVTGANGLLATNTIKQLLENGYEVKGALRDPDKFLLPAQNRLELVKAGLNDQAVLEQYMRDCDHVIHIAALTAQNMTRYTDYSKVNVTGTENIIRAAVKSGIKRIVYVSTANTIGYGMIKEEQESIPAQSPFIESHYAASKLEAETRVLAFAEEIDVVVVNPSFMLGAFDNKPGSGKIVMMGYNKRVILCPPGGKNFVHVRDVANGIIAALEKGGRGEKYLLTGDNLSYREFFERMSALTQSSPWIIIIPRWVLMIAGNIGDTLRIMGIRTAVSSGNMRILCVKNYYTNTKARQKLGLVFLPVEYAIIDALKWFRSRGMIK